jgi:hypothetical protein
MALVMGQLACFKPLFEPFDGPVVGEVLTPQRGVLLAGLGETAGEVQQAD